MAFDRPEIPQDVVRALTELPGIISELSRVSRKSKRAGQSKELALIRHLKQSLLAVATLGASTTESKNLHSALHAIHDESAPIRKAFNRAIAGADGRFDPQKYDIPSVREQWMTIRGQPMAQLLTVLQELQYTDEPVRLDPDTRSPQEGPQWAVNLLSRPFRIDTAFRNWDRHDESALPILVDELNGFAECIAELLAKVDNRILRESRRIVVHLAQLATVLKDQDEPT